MSKDLKSAGQFHADLIGDDWPDVGIVVVPIRRTWFVAALFLIVAAIGAEMASKRYAGLGMRTMARAAQALNDSKEYADVGMTALAQDKADEWASLKQLARQYPSRSGAWGLAGVGFFFLAAGCWGVSAYRCERRLPVLLPVLFAFYVLFIMMLV